MYVSVTQERRIEIDEEIIEFIKKQGRDFRVCTTCYGATLLPISYKQPKPSDLTVEVDGHKLYISRVQAQYIARVDKSMLAPLDYSKLEDRLI